MEYVRLPIAAMKGYVPGAQPDPGQRYMKLNSNENPYPPSPRVKEILQRLDYHDLRIYPDPQSQDLREKLGRLHGFSAGQIICGNGSDDILNILIRTFAQPGEAIGVYEPTFPLYKVQGLIHGVQNLAIPLAAALRPTSRPPFESEGLFSGQSQLPGGISAV